MAAVMETKVIATDVRFPVARKLRGTLRARILSVGSLISLTDIMWIGKRLPLVGNTLPPLH